MTSPSRDHYDLIVLGAGSGGSPSRRETSTPIPTLGEGLQECFHALAGDAINL
ncbi:hypothetical protein [Mycolicibacter terrae]|uniref:hypothetical protein n=1 Tax=Mycolicibacter terrae TaxID=1788 RepID=UPI000B946FEA|nr:hypothetical protein [Mycolicibacter terrae]SNV95868.1 Uncharacterised protein [Mycolicibacter terrae]